MEKRSSIAKSLSDKAELGRRRRMLKKAFSKRSSIEPNRDTQTAEPTASEDGHTIEYNNFIANAVVDAVDRHWKLHREIASRVEKHLEPEV